MATYTLTLGDDSVIGTDGDDLFSGVFPFDFESEGRDTLVGGGGWDVLAVGGDLTGSSYSDFDELRIERPILVSVDQLDQFERLTLVDERLFFVAGSGLVDLGHLSPRESTLFVHGG